MTERDDRELEAIVRAEHRAALRRWVAAAVAVLALSGMALRTELAQLLLGIGPINVLDPVPRHIRYSGYLEMQGQPVDAGTNITARLFNVPDGGASLWSQTGRIPITNGRFTLELGDEADGGARMLPASALAGNRLFLELTVGSPAVTLPRQQLLTVPYAQRSGDVITDDRVITVGATGADFTNIYSAMSYLLTKVVRGSVTVQILDGTYALPSTVNVTHVDGARIRIIGNLGNPNAVVFNATASGFVLDGPLAQLAGFRLVGPGTAYSGIRVVGRGHVQIGPAVRIQAFVLGIETAWAEASVTDVQMVGLNSINGSGISIAYGARVNASNVTISNFNSGIYLSNSASARVDTASISDVVAGVVSTRASAIELSGPIQITNATFGYAADLQSVVRGSTNTTFTNVTTPRLPPLNTVGSSNGNGFITE